jgi:hypothetical protein
MPVFWEWLEKSACNIAKGLLTPLENSIREVCRAYKQESKCLKEVVERLDVTGVFVTK